MSDDTLGMAYDMRRNSRGPEPPLEPRRWRNRIVAIGMVLMGVACAIVGVMLYYSLTYVSTTRAEVRAGIRVLSPDFSARMLKLEVREWQRVTAGQELARFDDWEQRAALTAAEAVVAHRKSLIVQAEANRRLAETDAESAIKVAATAVETARIGVTSAQAVLALRTARVKEEIRRAEAQRGEAKAQLERLKKGARPEEIQAAEARLASARALAALHELEVKQSLRLREQGIESEFDLEIKKTRLITQQNVAREAELALATLKAGPRAEDIEAAQKVLEARDAALAIASAGEKELKALEATLATRKAELKEAEAEVEHAEARQEEVVAAALERVKVARSELKEAEADVAMRRVALGKMTLRSPVAGTVARVFFCEGEVVRSGEPAIEVADDSQGRWVEGFVLEEDAERVREGQPAQIEIGLGSDNYVEATVEQVGFAKGPAGPSRTRTYDEAGGYGRPAPVWVKLRLADTVSAPRPGTSANVLIRVRGAEKGAGATR